MGKRISENATEVVGGEKDKWKYHRGGRWGKG